MLLHLPWESPTSSYQSFSMQKRLVVLDTSDKSFLLLLLLCPQSQYFYFHIAVAIRENSSPVKISSFSLDEALSFFSTFSGVSYVGLRHTGHRVCRTFTLVHLKPCNRFFLVWPTYDCTRNLKHYNSIVMVSTLFAHRLISFLNLLILSP